MKGKERGPDFLPGLVLSILSLPYETNNYGASNILTFLGYPKALNQLDEEGTVTKELRRFHIAR
eukprot:5866048-Amphidinium_carterae.1